MVRILGWRKGVGSFRKHPQLVRRFNELIGSRLDAANSHSVITLSEKTRTAISFPFRFDFANFTSQRKSENAKY